MRFLISLSCLIVLSGCTYYFGDSFANKFNREGTPLLIEFKTRPAPLTRNETVLSGRSLLEHWASKQLGDWKNQGKVSEPRIMIAKLALGNDVKQVNEYIQSLKPWGQSGSTWALFPHGDYDFTEINLCNLIYLFGNDPMKLNRETTRHIINRLLIENGSRPRTSAPMTLGLMRDTENHILMKEISRYLKNQWIFENENQDKRFDNTRNGLGPWLYYHLVEMEETGLYEFEADPYMGYTMSALLTLHAHTNSEKLKLQVQRVIDLLNWEYALGSHRFRKCSPFRRRLERGKKTTLDQDPHTAMMKTWVFKHHNIDEITLEDLPCCLHQALIALMLPYQIPDVVHDMMVERPIEYFVKISHGIKGSPGIYSGDNQYLLSAGGVQRGKRSQISARPISLILDDNATDLIDCFHSTGKGKMKKWKNTGVYHRFACSNTAFHIPNLYSSEIDLNGWSIFKPYLNSSLRIATYSMDDLGILAIFPEWKSSSKYLAKLLNEHNANASLLYKRFMFPDSTTLTFDLKAPKNRWVIQTIDGENLDRKFDFWPRISGYMEK